MKSCPDYNPEVRQQGSEESKMLAHNPEPVVQALAVALFGHPAHQVIADHKPGMHVLAAFFQNPDAPVVVGAQISRHVLGRQTAARHEGLVYHQHSAEVVAPRKPGRQRAGAELAHQSCRLSGIVHESGVAVQHVRFEADKCGNFFHRIGCVQVVAAVQKPNKVARSHPQAFVHGIVQSPVFF